ncbi:hypothetical protein ISF9_021 [Microbacterium phage vB_MoxS-ISF9]|uniref:Uncharacterized protein n=1 Tax=Microbacterium phage vB_MoxS-ISF9 TaxID=1458670 RepID=W8PF56_9CAUD|nr:hypothetical protein ISF9_021 [Microbacterium phage vB_MoxS-ISF9]AHL18491.1 hypothetical protein ISF9_021 [Microbacterium phage vB_MoxS-ISF9]
MVTLTPPPASWEESILITARLFMVAEVCFYEMVEGEEWDPITGTGGPEASVIWRGKARVQHLRAPRDQSNEYQTSDTRNFRFQLDPADNPPLLYTGVKARVLNGGRDPMLETLAYVVDSGVNSSQMAVRTVELTSDMRPTEWNWTA